MKDGKKKRKKIDLKDVNLARSILNRANKIKDTSDKNAHKARNITPSNVIQTLSNSFVFVGERRKPGYQAMFGDFEHWLYFSARTKKLQHETIRFHGTSFAGLVGIIHRKHIAPSTWGMLGPGVYVGHWDKARVYGDVILEVNCNMGQISFDPKDRRADTIAALKGSNHISSLPLRNDEWCIRNSTKVEIWGIYIKKTILEMV